MSWKIPCTFPLMFLVQADFWWVKGRDVNKRIHPQETVSNQSKWLKIRPSVDELYFLDQTEAQGTKEPTAVISLYFMSSFTTALRLHVMFDSSFSTVTYAIAVLSATSSGGLQIMINSIPLQSQCLIWLFWATVETWQYIIVVSVEKDTLSENFSKAQ